MAFNVLLVDDSTSMRAVLKKMVRASGFHMGECFEAGDGTEALKVLTDNWVDIVLTDINMPNMNGLELVAEMKRDQLLSSIPVVVVSTERSEGVVEESIKTGASGYIKKPFHPEVIRRTLYRILGEADNEESPNDEGDEGCDF